MIGIEIRGLEQLLRITATDLRPTLRAVLHGVGELVRDQIAQAPGPARKPTIWASEKQRRYVMAQVRRFGPWVRESHPLSQRLLASWTVRDESDTRVIVGNKATTYGPWVQSSEYQQPMHAATGWITDAAAVEAVVGSGDVERVLGQAFEHALRGA